MKATRREFCALGAAALVGLASKSDRTIAGSFVNDSFSMGHLLRDGAQFPTPRQTVRVPLIIVGGGIAGLSAAWRLQKRGFHDFLLLEMNSQAGGNAGWGENEITAYPWAAHYVPVPGKKAALVRELFTDLGVLKDGKWDERHLCFAPQEHLFLYGRWQEGIEPESGLRSEDKAQFRRFADLIHDFRQSGVFTVPMELGISADWRAQGRSGRVSLDRLSFGDWLAQQGFNSKPFLWYMNYACRDDYGALAADTSAWAGIHYFASREPDEKGPLTWPEGNGWITKQLLARVGGFVRTGQMVHRIARERSLLRVYAGETEYQCQCVIFAAPTFLAPYLIQGMPRLHDFEYSPWLTANLTLESIPESQGVETAWDNVFMDSPSLGYVDAMHQSLRTFNDKTVWTFYWALAEGSARDNRRLLLEKDKDWSYWKEAILHDLERVHKDIRQRVSRIDIMRMGHAMVRPTPGAIFSAERNALRNSANRSSGMFAGLSNDHIFFANSDLSGISIFEEAQYNGVAAAEKALRLLGNRGS